MDYCQVLFNRNEMYKCLIDGETDWHSMSELKLLVHHPAYTHLKDFMG